MKFLDKELSEYVSVIKEINSEIKLFFKQNKSNNGFEGFLKTYEINEEIADNLSFSKISNIDESDNLDKILIELTKEYVINDQIDTKPQLVFKKETLRKAVSAAIVSKTDLNIPTLNNEIIRLIDLHNKYNSHKYPIEVLFITAVPLEFRAMYRRMESVLRIQNNWFKYIMNSDKDENKEIKKKRDNFWAEGIIIRNNKFVKVAIQFVKQYGSLTSQSAIRDNIEFYPSIKEAFLIGIAGQMEETGKILIGDLALSTGFYNSYPNKLEADINYTDREQRLNINDYHEVLKKDINDWKPSLLFEKRPETTDYNRERDSFSVVSGLYVSGSSVVRHSSFKNTILKSFTDSIAVEMEAVGCYEVLKERGIELKIIKGICDWADEFKDDKWQRYCADLAAEFALDYVIEKYGKAIKD